jgi:hypothetical protein
VVVVDTEVDVEVVDAARIVEVVVTMSVVVVVSGAGVEVVASPRSDPVEQPATVSASAAPTVNCRIQSIYSSPSVSHGTTDKYTNRTR